MKETILQHFYFLNANPEIKKLERFADRSQAVSKATDHYATLRELELGIFDEVKVRQFDTGSLHIWLWKDHVTRDTFGQLVKLLVDLYGADCNGNGYLLDPTNETRIIENYDSREWEFDLQHQCFQEEKQPDIQYFYSISLSRHVQMVELQILNFDHLMRQYDKEITWL